MRKVIVSNLVSLDGFIAGPNGEVDWFTGIVGKEFEAYIVEAISTIDTMLFGRVTYEHLASYWPTASPEQNHPSIIYAMNNTSKVVFSKTLQNVEWKNSRLAKRDIAEEASKLKQQPGKDIVIYGSGSIVSALAQKGLIDEYRIFIAPVVLGSGKPLFGGIDLGIHLKLVETKTFGAGLTLLRYQLINEHT
ncbi:MAG: dihydrofolate reductase family protein [Ignavibacteriales bacterium]|nr:dihydrofolate reductase family protein [Ignavibacteriales bacterium]